MIDYCFFSNGNVAPLRFEICDGMWGENNQYHLSDHNPLITNIRLIYEIKTSHPDSTENGFDSLIDSVS